MVKLYKTLIALILIFALGHIVYTFADDALPGGEFRVWFFSAALALLFNAALNILHLRLRLPETRTWSLLSNVMLFAFTIALAFVVSEAQVYCLVAIAGLTIAAGLRIV